MKLKVNTKQLLQGLERAALLSSDSTLKTLKLDNKVKLIASSNNLEIHISDMITHLKVEVSAWEVKEQGELILDNIKALIKALKHFKGDEVSIEANGSDIEFKSDTKRAKVSIYDMDDVDSIFKAPEVEILSSHDYIQKKLLQRLKAISYATAKDESRPILQGICFRDDDMVALDGYRLALSKDEDLQLDKGFVIAPEVISVLIKTLEDKKDDPITIQVAEKHGDHAVFTYGNMTVTSRCLEGQFLNYRDIIRKDCSTEVEINAKELLSEVKYIADLAINKQKPLAVFDLSEQKMELLGRNTEIEATSEFAADVKGDDIKICFNSKYIMDPLKIIGNDTANMEFTSPVNPCIIRHHDNLHMVLPVKI